MKYTSHPLRSNQDLLEIGRLLRRACAEDKRLNAWSVCRFDIWAQRRMDDAASHDRTEWQNGFQLWRDGDGTLVGAIFAFDNHRTRRNPDPHALILHPAHPALAEPMLDWAESQAAPDVEIPESQQFLLDIVQARGYVRSSDFMIVREKPLTGTPQEAVQLPDGYRIEVLEPSDWPAYFDAVFEVFGMMDSASAFGSIQQAPSNIRDLHLNALSESGEIAAFCSVWLDRTNQAAEFEPVGTRPNFQKKGLGSALLAQACNRLRRMNCPLVLVESWSESVGANKLYEANGLAEVDRFHSWKKAG